MKFYLTLLCLSLILLAADAAISRQKLEPCPGHPGRCYSPGPPKIDMRVGEVRQTPGKCESMTCSKEGNHFILEKASCGVLLDKKCKIVEDKSKPYPKCCPVPQC